MKRCPFCAEEIQDDAVVCRFCQRDLGPAAPPARRRGGAFVLLLIAGIVAICLAIAVLFIARTRPDERRLNVSGARSVAGLLVTNHDQGSLSGCVATIHDAHGTTWSALLPRKIAPLETVTFEWSSFTAAGQPMPAYLGQERGVVLSCFAAVPAKRLSVGLGR